MECSQHRNKLADLQFAHIGSAGYNVSNLAKEVIMVSYSSQQQHLTAAERVSQALRTAITTGALPAGVQIRQEEVAAQYKVSRMPVREAFRQLEAEGLIDIYPGRGAFITRLDPSEIREIFEIRILLESDALKRACLSLTPTIVERAKLLLDQLEGVQDGIGFGKLDEAFHTTIYTPAQRPRLLNLIATFRRQVTHFYYNVTPLEKYRDQALQEHRQILTACQTGDAAAAVAALEIHLHHSAQNIVASNQQLER